MNKQLLYNIVIALAVIAIGLFIINQFIEFQFKAQLLTAPCDLCRNNFGLEYDCRLVRPINFTNIVFP